MTTVYPFYHPFYVMAKPIGSACNLRCRYCYYLEKGALYPNGGRHVLEDPLLEHFIRDYIASQAAPQVLFTWHGGEPLLLPLSYYEHVVQLERRYAGGRQIDNVIQTNGTLINDSWASFFHDQGWLVGVSIDGPREYHDAYRRHSDGKGSFDDVIRGIDCLNRHHVEWNAMAVVNRANAEHPLEFYNFFKSIGCHYIQFTPVVERFVQKQGATRLASAAEEGVLADYSVTPQQWGHFVCTIFDEWVRKDIGETFVQLFDATLANWLGVAPGVCALATTCGQAVAMEWNGDVYSCDHFVFPEFLLGNIRQHTITELMMSARQQAFGESKLTSLPSQCRQCRWLFACHGECPRNRFVPTSEPGRKLNYLCEGYRMFFHHAEPAMNRMAEAIRRGGEASDIMH